jgi:APA family basic amino acid/polyamine antiporter
MMRRQEPGSKSSLRRSLGRTTLTLITAAMIIDTGIFAALGMAMQKAGTGILLAILIGGLVALATGLSAAQLGVRFPKEGGAFTWAREYGHESVAFVAGCSYLGKGTFSVSVVALAFATYLARALPALPIHIVAAVAVLLVTALNYRGIEPTSRVLIAVLVVDVGLLAVFAMFASPSVKPANLTPVWGNGLTGVMGGAAAFFFTWDGFIRPAIMAGEVQDPKRSIPFAVVVGLSSAAIVFLGVAAVTLGVLGPKGSSADDLPILAAAMKAIGRWGAWCVLIAAWTAALGELTGDLLSASRVGLAMGEARELPGWLGAVHPRFHIPNHTVLVIGSTCAVVSLLFDLRKVIPLTNVFTLIWYSVTNLCALRLRKSERFASPIVSWFGLAGCIALFAWQPPWALATGITVLFLLAGTRAIRGRFHPAR